MFCLTVSAFVSILQSFDNKKNPAPENSFRNRINIFIDY